MTLMGMFDTTDGNRLFVQVGEAAGVDPGTARRSMDMFCPVIAAALQDKVADDPELVDDLMELLQDNSEPGIATEEAHVDGKAMLAAIFGTQKAATAALKDHADGIPAKAVPKLAAIAAVTVVAAVAERTGAAPMPLAGVQTAAGGGGSIVGTVLNALIAGAIQGVVRQLTAKKRSSSTRTRSTTTRRKRKTTTSRRRKTTASRSRTTGSISLEDILGGIFGKSGK